MCNYINIHFVLMKNDILFYWYKVWRHKQNLTVFEFIKTCSFCLMVVKCRNSMAWKQELNLYPLYMERERERFPCLQLHKRFDSQMSEIDSIHVYKVFLPLSLLVSHQVFPKFYHFGIATRWKEEFNHSSGVFINNIFKRAKVVQNASIFPILTETLSSEVDISHTHCWRTANWVVDMNYTYTSNNRKKNNHRSDWKWHDIQ